MMISKFKLYILIVTLFIVLYLFLNFNNRVSRINEMTPQPEFKKKENNSTKNYKKEIRNKDRSHGLPKLKVDPAPVED